PQLVRMQACNRTVLHSLSTSLRIHVEEVFATRVRDRPHARIDFERRRARSSDRLPNAQWPAMPSATDCVAKFSTRARPVRVPLRLEKSLSSWYRRSLYDTTVESGPGSPFVRNSDRSFRDRLHRNPSRRSA